MSAPTVVLYGREGCHLCEVARGELLALRDALPEFVLREVDIEADDRLHAALLERIPVFEVGGEAVCELGLDRDALAAALVDAAAGA
jgi:hypothetical protein